MRDKLLAVALLAMFAVPVADAHASAQSDRKEQLRYARETVNLTYAKFMGRKADFTNKGCNANRPKAGGCKKPSPYNKFDWTTDSCSRPTPASWKRMFDAPCQLHDFGYRNFGNGLKLGSDENTRAWVDSRFRAEMKRLCNDSFGRAWQKLNREACFNEADVMFAAVRNFNKWREPFPEPGIPVPTITPIQPLPPLEAQPLPQLSPIPTGNPSVRLAQGPAAPAGYRYAITLSGFAPGIPVSISCRDSVDPGGFYTFNLTTDGAGNASTASYCYSGDGPDHWVIAGGVESNHVRWGGAAPPPPPPPTTYAETTGGVAHTWTNYTNAGGTQGPTIAAYATVQIACKLQGFRVADGNTWWYRIASSPWNSQFYVSADAFYNNGQTSGSLHGTPFVDPKVRDC
jgi:hypothetical protein